HRARQGPQRCAQDIVAIDAPGRRARDGNLRARADLEVQLLARFRIELLGVIEPARNALGIENHGRSNYRPGERPAPCFIAPGDRPHATFERGALAPERRPNLLLCERQARRGATRGCFASGCCATHAAMVPATSAKSMDPFELLSAL